MNRQTRPPPTSGRPTLQRPVPKPPKACEGFYTYLFIHPKDKMVKKPHRAGSIPRDPPPPRTGSASGSLFPIALALAQAAAGQWRGVGGVEKEGFGNPWGSMNGCGNEGLGLNIGAVGPEVGGNRCTSPHAKPLQSPPPTPPPIDRQFRPTLITLWNAAAFFAVRERGGPGAALRRWKGPAAGLGKAQSG
jgi:hypothetical protein